QRIVKGDKMLKIDSTVSLYASALTKLGIKEPWSYPRLQVSNLKLSNSNNPTNLDYKDIKPIKIAIFPSANHFTKRYPISSWIQLINSHPQYCFTLLGSTADKDICDNISKHCPGNCINQCSTMSLSELYRELSTFQLIISGDTGPMHLAATLNKPQIAIFGGTHPRLGFKPLNDKAIVLCADLPCQPCSLHGKDKCPEGHFDCMNAINPALLSSAIKKALSS
ncbi:MAG TPA: glycosyltransferase family 9 protein, partial [Candidatus Syntrophosphaera thermopropionivorans]|nr:glycosyltransferase family 9 protein [Candidatus Syntrophosphaera thermopropionivorans]